MTDQIRLDDRDHRLLALLQQDSRISNADLAQAVGMSASALWRRVRSLEEAGVIDRFGAIVNPDRMGLQFHAIVHVHLTRHAPDGIDGFIRAIQGRSEVLECYATTGQADYHLRVMCRDLEAYNRFLEQFLFRIPAVASAQTNVVLRTAKRAGPIRP